MANVDLSVRDARAFRPAITSLFSKQRIAARLRRSWRGYWERQARSAVGVMLYALDDRRLADLGIDRDAVAPLLHGLAPGGAATASARSAWCARASARTTH